MTEETASGGVARPDITTHEAEALVAEAFGIEASAKELGSNQDRNFVMTAGDGTRYVLRVDNPIFGDETRDAQHAAMDRCEEHGIRVPKRFPDRAGNVTTEWNGHKARLSEFIDLHQMVDLEYFSPQVLRAFGDFAADAVLAFEGLEHPGLDRKHQWDMRVAYEETLVTLEAVEPRELRDTVHTLATEAKSALDAVISELPVQPIHGDLTDDNVMGERRADGRTYPKVMIDFGDLALGLRIAELAVSVSSMLHHVDGDPLRALETVRAFAEQLKRAGKPVTQAEARALWPLVVLRAAILITNGHRQLEIDGDNDYVRERIAGEQEIFDNATKFSLVEMTEQVLITLGHMGADTGAGAGLQLVAKPEPVADLKEVLPGAFEPADSHADGNDAVRYLDLGVESEALAAGLWLEADIEQALEGYAIDEGADVVVKPYGAYRLTRTAIDSVDVASTFPIDTELAFAGEEPITVLSPVSGSVLSTTETEIAIETADKNWILTISGVAAEVSAGSAIEKGQELGKTLGTTLTTENRIAVGISRADAHEAMTTIRREAPGRARLVAPARAAAWLRLSPDPHFLLGLESHIERDESGDEQLRREEVFAKAQERYYERPMQIERGWRHHLIDTTGRAYVDMVNNVTGIGHGHPRVADAVNKQMRLLGTNSRFLYRSLAEYSERLLKLLPENSGLDTVLLVNSGSEAVDLALRLAQAATGHKTVVALREAYHGWTMASDAVTTSAFDNPYALETRPDWIHIADVPNTYRGTHRGEGAVEKYLTDLGADLEQLKSEGRDVAGFICESVLGNAGGVLLPDGYLAGAYEQIRANGGLVIADEVQVGFGRMGTSFWGFEQSGVKPDIITIAKPMGNGFPIGGVITSKKIADALATQGQFFSSAGGNPVSCQVGMAVLDAMEQEQLQENARVVGNHLRAGFEALAEKHDIIGTVHGEGLYLGVELVRDRETLEPATEETDAICERMRELGIIVLSTSERSNVLKVKPPLTLTKESADVMLSALDYTLSHGW